MSKEHTAFYLEKVHKDVPFVVQEMLNEVRNYITDQKIVDEKWTGIRDLYLTGIIDEREVREIVDRYRRLDHMYENGLFTP